MILNEDLFNDVENTALFENFDIVADGYAPDEYDKEWAIDDINNVHVDINDVIEYHVNEDADYFILTFKDGTKKAWYIHSGMYIPDKDLDESLKEDFDDVVVTQIPDVDIEVKAGDIELRGPIPGVDTGIADLLLSLINGENETIQSYNTFIASLEGHEDFIKVITDIQQEEMNHVGMLQTLLKEVSPNAEVIHQGEVEAEGYLDKEDKNSLEIDQMIGEIDDSFDNGFGGIYV